MALLLTVPLNDQYMEMVDNVMEEIRTLAQTYWTDADFSSERPRGQHGMVNVGITTYSQLVSISFIFDHYQLNFRAHVETVCYQERVTKKGSKILQQRPGRLLPQQTQR